MKRVAVLMVALAVVTVACGNDSAEPPAEIVMLTHDSFAVSPGVLEQFTAATGVVVTVRRGGDAGTMVGQAILTKDTPIADVLYGIDNTFLSRAIDAGIFLPYQAEDAALVLPGLAAGDEVTPIDYGDVCLNYDKAALAAAGLAVPDDLRALTRPEYARTLVVENPATSSPGLAFLMATIATFPDGSAYTWRQYWADLRDNDVLVVPDWDTAYYSEFAGGEGDRPLVVSYASSPPAGVIFSDPRPATAPTGVVVAGCFRQIEYAGILTGTEAEPWARRLIDFMLSKTFQEDMPLNMFVFPARGDAALPAEFVEHTVIPPNPASLDPAVIDANRAAWIDDWTEIMRS